ncbi:MAG TPA: AraC family transcriptional regulator [Steroidobacteraceae bacterium]
MRTSTEIKPFRAIEALASAVHVGPSLIRESRVFGGVCVCAWDTPWLEGFELPESDELMLAYHSRGSHDVRRQQGALLSRNRSIPGLLTLIPPGHSVAYHTGGHVSFTTLHISRTALGEFLRSGADLPAHDLFAFRDPFVASCVDSLLREARVPDRWSPRFVSAVTEALLLQLLRHTPSEPDPGNAKSLETRVAETQSRIDANLAGDLSLETLAEEAGFSRAHFARVFRQVVNESPHHYVMNRRIEHAKDLLTGSTAALKEIAHEAGFCSQAHLTHLFRTRLGLTPQQYRRKHGPGPH